MKNQALVVITAAVAIGFADFASAGLIVTTGVDNTGTDNVLSNACSGNVTGPALTVQGCLNTSHSFLINFTGDELMKISGGQASIVADDGAFSFLNISLAAAGWTFSKLLLNIDANDDGAVTFTGSPGGVNGPWALDKNGENKFILTGEDFSSISFATTVGINSIDLVADVKQVRIGGFKNGGTIVEEPFPVPEPGMLVLFGSALMALALGRKRKTKA